jgi:hypothetical protein
MVPRLQRAVRDAHANASLDLHIHRCGIVLMQRAQGFDKRFSGDDLLRLGRATRHMSG